VTDLAIRNGDVTLAASVYGPEGAPDLLFLHGISATRDTWEEAFRRLEDRFRVWAIDFRGHGFSDRAERYLVEDYVSDAAAALDFIGRPTVIVSHSLGSVVGAVLAQGPHPFLKALFMEDPPFYMGETEAYARSGNAESFGAIQAFLTEAQLTGAAFGRYLEWTKAMPASLGGARADHSDARHILSAASGYLRQDPACWTPALSTAIFESVDVEAPLKVPAILLQADPALDAAIGVDQIQRFAATNPKVRIVRLDGAPHRIHATAAFAGRCLDEIEAFVTAAAAAG